MSDELLATQRRNTVALSCAFTTVSYLLIAATAAGWAAASFVTVASALLLATHWVRTRDPLWTRLALMGAMGVPFVFVGDWICVKLGGLTYQPGGPFFVVSPLYLPLFYPQAVFQIWFTRELVRRAFGLPTGAVLEGRVLAFTCLVCASFGAIYVPFYEYLAKWGDLWIYVGVPGPGDATVPWYVIGAEVLQFTAMPLILLGVERKSLGTCALLGGVMGLAVVGCWTVALLLFVGP